MVVWDLLRVGLATVHWAPIDLLHAEVVSDGVKVGWDVISPSHLLGMDNWCCSFTVVGSEVKWTLKPRFLFEETSLSHGAVPSDSPSLQDFPLLAPPQPNSLEDSEVLGVETCRGIILWAAVPKGVTPPVEVLAPE